MTDKILNYKKSFRLVGIKIRIKIRYISVYPHSNLFPFLYLLIRHYIYLNTYQKQNNQINFTYSVKPVYSVCLTKWHLFNLNSKTNYHVTISYFSYNKCYCYFFLGYQYIYIPGKYNPKSFKCGGCVGSDRIFRKCLCWLLI